MAKSSHAAIWSRNACVPPTISPVCASNSTFNSGKSALILSTATLYSNCCPAAAPYSFSKSSSVFIYSFTVIFVAKIAATVSSYFLFTSSKPLTDFSMLSRISWASFVANLKLSFTNAITAARAANAAIAIPTGPEAGPSTDNNVCIV